MPAQSLTLEVQSSWSGMRIDKALSEVAEIGSRARAAHLIGEGRVLVNGSPVKASHKLSLSDQILIQLPASEPSELKRLDLPLEIHFEDEEIAVINKPAGLVVHPSAGHSNDTLVNVLLHHMTDLSMKWKERPGIVHRLDKDTTGLLVIAKTDASHEALVRQFQERSVYRRYQALAWGRFKPTEGRITSWLARHPNHRKRFASLRDVRKRIITTENPPQSKGKWAATNFNVIDYNDNQDISLVELRLETGRTHQIRVHLSEAGHPICGDEIYGGRRKFPGELPHLALHARELGFRHPRTGDKLNFQVHWSIELKPALESLFPMCFKS